MLRVGRLRFAVPLSIGLQFLIYFATCRIALDVLQSITLGLRISKTWVPEPHRRYDRNAGPSKSFAHRLVSLTCLQGRCFYRRLLRRWRHASLREYWHQQRPFWRSHYRYGGVAQRQRVRTQRLVRMQWAPPPRPAQEAKAHVLFNTIFLLVAARRCDDGLNARGGIGGYHLSMIKHQSRDSECLASAHHSQKRLP